MSRTVAVMVRRLGFSRAPSAPSPGPVKAPRRQGAQRSGDTPVLERHHRDVRGGGARAAIFGLQDGLVSNLAIILGVAGDHPVASLVRVVGLAVLVSGAFSMASGEYVSMKAQRELMERELELERRELNLRPEGERRELTHIYERRGLNPGLARELAGEVMRDPDLALETHAREELGIEPGSLGSPLQAAFSSFAAFIVGAVIPLIPWFFTTGHAAIVTSVILGALGALGIGAVLSAFTGQSWVRSASRQLVFTIVPAGITYGIGTALGVSGVG